MAKSRTPKSAADLPKPKRTKRRPAADLPKPKRVTSKRTASRPAADAPPFQRVQDLVRRIPRGKVATYGQLSHLIGGRLTPVGVGWAIRAAPEDSIPWQRVVNSQGGVSTGPHHPGLQLAMLESEGVR